MRTVSRARELAAAGWTPVPIGRLLAKEFALSSPPSANTIRCWIDPGYRDYHAELNRRAMRRRRSGSAQVSEPPDVLLALRLEDGLTYPTIAKVARRFLGLELTEYQVRDRLQALGVPKNPNKTRARSTA